MLGRNRRVHLDNFYLCPCGSACTFTPNRIRIYRSVRRLVRIAVTPYLGYTGPIISCGGIGVIQSMLREGSPKRPDLKSSEVQCDVLSAHMTTKMSNWLYFYNWI